MALVQGERPLLLINSLFPRGRLGAGLLLLRTTFGMIVIARSVLLLSAAESTTTGPILAGVLGVVTGALLVVGFFTVLASMLVGVLFVSAVSAAGLKAHLFDCGTAAILGCVVGFALVLLGPGAFSADARFFGPREIIIPPGTNSIDDTSRGADGLS